MATTNDFKGIVKLSEEEYQQLKTSGTLTKGGTTINYEPETTIYVTANQVYYLPLTGGTINGNLSVQGAFSSYDTIKTLTRYGNAFELRFDGNTGMEIGRKDGTKGSAYIDFHTDGNAKTDFNSCIIAQGNSLDIKATDGLKINGKSLIDTIYPVGSIYMSLQSESPASFLGGTWTQIKDKFLLGAGNSYAAGSSAGNASHTLTISEMPSHTHKFNRGTAHYYSGSVVSGYNNSTSIFPGFVENSASGRPDDYQEITGAGKYFVQPTGSGSSFSTMPPYIAVYIWQRTA